MFIHVKSLNGNKNQINVDEDATVKQVKLILQEKEGIPAEQLRIIFKGKLLNDTDKLKDKGTLKEDRSIETEFGVLIR